MKDIRPLPAPEPLPVLPGLPEQDWLGRDQPTDCLVEQYLRSLPPEQRHGAVVMISCPCRRCTPWSLGV